MENKDILETIDHRDGMTVPDGYFDDFAARVTASLPEAEWERPPKVLPRTMWDRVRPYVYLAAMFLGVWCMMSLVDIFKASSTEPLLDNNQVLAQALADDSFMIDYFVTEGNLSEDQILDDLYDSGIAATSVIEFSN